jgi:hypothetical protein
MTAVATAARQPNVSVVSMSWGFQEGQAILQQDEALYDGIFTTPAGHAPVTFLASTGDYGSAVPEYPAYSPNVVAVGGTSLTLHGDDSYSSETGWGYYSSQVGSFIGSGGGTSPYEPEPAYQAGVQSSGMRSTPDVSFVADPNTGVWIADNYNLSGDQPWQIAGGTSLAAPSWAGLIAVVNQGRAAAGEPTLSSSAGVQTQQALYSLSSTDFHSVTTGTNGAFTASAGYNMVTGLGTPAADLLVPDLIAYNTVSGPNRTAADMPVIAGSGGNAQAAANAMHNLFLASRHPVNGTPWSGPSDGRRSALASPAPGTVTARNFERAEVASFIPMVQMPLESATFSTPGVGFFPQGRTAIDPAPALYLTPGNGPRVEQPTSAAEPVQTRHRDASDNLLLAGEGDDLQISAGGREVLIGGFAASAKPDADVDEATDTDADATDVGGLAVQAYLDGE